MDSLKKNRLVIAGLALVLAVALFAWLRHNQQQGDAPRQTTDELAALLVPVETDTVAELRIQRPADEAPVVIKKQGSAWRLSAPLEADADQSKVDAVLQRLAELKVLRVISENANKHERLEVSEDTGVHVVAVDENGDELINLYVGSVQAGRTVVRKAGEDRTLTVENSIKYAFSQDLRSWRNRKVTVQDPAELHTVVFQPREGESYTFERGEDDLWHQAEGETALERFDGTKVQNVIASLSKITATDFAAPDVTVESAGLTEGVARVELRYGAAEEESDATGEPATESPTAAAQTIVLIGSAKGPADSQHYLQRQGHDEIFVVSNYHGEKLFVTAESFQKEEEAAPEE